MAVPKTRPINIAIIPAENLSVSHVDRTENVNLGKIVKNLNSLQTLFHYEISHPSMRLGEYDSVHGYSDKIYFDTIETRISKSNFQWAIAIVPDEIEGGSFNRHDEKRGLGIVTVENYDNFVPPGASISKYLAFLILCESFCIVSNKHLEHSERFFCLFDMCHRKSDLIESLRHAYIHDNCIEKIIEAGFNENDLASARKILNYVKRSNPFYLLKKYCNHAGVTFALGIATGLAGNLLVNFNSAIAKLITELIFVTILLLFSVNLLISFRRGSKNKKHAGSGKE